MIYIIYDTALNGPYTLMLLQNAYPQNQSIFTGTKDEVLSDVAPYLFQVDENLFEKINSPLTSLKAIVIIQSEEKLNNLLSHFRQFIYEKINGQENYFRFWDARVLERFLPACPAEKLDNFFEGINSFFVLTNEKNEIKRFFLKRGKLQTAVSALKELFVVQNELLQEEQVEHAKTEPARKPKRKFFD